MVSLVVRLVVRLVVSLAVRLVVRLHSPALQPFLVSVGPAVETILVLNASLLKRLDDSSFPDKGETDDKGLLKDNEPCHGPLSLNTRRPTGQNEEV